MFPAPSIILFGNSSLKNLRILDTTYLKICFTQKGNIAFYFSKLNFNLKLAFNKLNLLD